MNNKKRFQLTQRREQGIQYNDRIEPWNTIHRYGNRPTNIHRHSDPDKSTFIHPHSKTTTPRNLLTWPFSLLHGGGTVSLAGAWIAGAVRAALAAALCSKFHLRSLEVPVNFSENRFSFDRNYKARMYYQIGETKSVLLLGTDADDEGLGGGILCVAQIRVHPTSASHNRTNRDHRQRNRLSTRNQYLKNQNQ